MPLYDSTYIWCCVSESHSGATLGEKDRGSAESTDKAWSESCRGSVQRRDRAATWQKEAERDHFLTLSLIRLCRPSLPPPSPQVILGTVSLSHAALMATVCINVGISAWIGAPV